MKFGDETSSKFNVLNGVKQGGVLSPIVFAVYKDGLLDRLADKGVGWYMDICFVGVLAFADDLNLLSPSSIWLKGLSWCLRKMVVIRYRVFRWASDSSGSAWTCSRK